MHEKKKLEEVIARRRKMIEESEKIMEQIPKHLRPSQEFALGIYKKKLEVLELELAKYEKSSDKRISNV